MKVLSPKLIDAQNSAAQSIYEITELQKLIQKEYPEIIVEIGLDRGGTIGRWLQIDSVKIVISIDYDYAGIIGNYENIDKQNIVDECKDFADKNNIEFFFIKGDSQSQETIDTLSKILNGKNIDFIFIDGDHHYDFIKKDYENYKQFNPKIMAFHDIKKWESSDAWQLEVYKFWDEIKLKHKIIEIVDYIDNIPKGLLTGIGVIHFDENKKNEDNISINVQNKNMKIALCLSGQPRHFRKAYFNNFNTLYNKNPEMDVFFHTWHNKEETGKPILAAQKQFSGIVENNLEEKLIELYKPKLYRIDKQRIFDNLQEFHVDGDYMSPHKIGNFSWSYSIQECLKLLSEYEIEHHTKYDLVALTRFDYAINSELVLNNLDGNCMNVVEIGDGFICDQFFVSNSENMKKLQNIYRYMHERFRKDNVFNIERNLYHMFSEQNILLNVINVNSKIYGR